jgi:hypothetical protein
VEPGAEGALAAEERELLPGPHEHVLRELLGALPVRDHASADREHAVDVHPVQPLERPPITRGRERHVRLAAGV